MKTSRKLFCLLISIVFLGSFAAVPSVLAAKKRLPKIVGIATYKAGSKGYAIVTGVANAVQKKSGIQIRTMPIGTNNSRVKTVVRKESLYGAIYENGIYSAQGGFWDYLEDGPQDLAIGWMGYIGNGTLLTRADSGIKTWEDIKGKRMSNYQDYDPGTQMLAKAMLAWGGLSEEDVKPLPATYASGLELLKDGKVDVSEATASASTVYEIGASVHGIHLFEFDPKDKEAIKRFKRICPIAGPGKVPVGFGYSEAKPGNVIVYPGYYITRPDSDEYLVYTMTKAIIAGYDIYKSVHPEAKYWSLDSALNLDTLNLTGLPYHKGAIKAFKEIGRWTARHEKWQQSRLVFRTKLKAEYQKTIKEAKAKGIKPKTPEFEKIWLPKFQTIRSDMALIEH